MTPTARTPNAIFTFPWRSNERDFIIGCYLLAARGLMAERQILQDTVSVRWSKERGLPHRSAAFGLFTLQQMTPASSVEQHFPGCGYFETFCHGLSCLNAFGAAHIVSLSSAARETISRRR